VGGQLRGFTRSGSIGQLAAAAAAAAAARE